MLNIYVRAATEMSALSKADSLFTNHGDGRLEHTVKYAQQLTHHNLYTFLYGHDDDGHHDGNTDLVMGHLSIA